MKAIFLSLSLVVAMALNLQAQTDYQQWECSYVRVKPANVDLFEKGLAAHNKKYHNADPYKIGVFDVLTGPYSGGYFIGLGPVTWTQIEGRPTGSEHDMDWQQHVAQYIDEESETEYWRMDKDIKYKAANSDNFTRSRIRNFTLKPGERDRFESLLRQVVAVYKQKAYPASYNVYWRQGASQGPHAITEINMDHWSYFDRPDTFEKDFNEVHGEGAFQRYIEEFELCLDRSKTYDELIVFKPELSSNF